MGNFTIRKVTDLVILACILVATFATLFTHFHGLRVPFFKQATAKRIYLGEPLNLEGVSYDTSNEDAMMMELLRPSPPDEYPTPRRIRRGTSDDTSGTLFFMCNAIVCIS